MKFKSILPLFIITLCFQSDALSREGPYFSVEENYRVQAVDIPMRDGIKLRTHIYIPLDQTEPHAILMNRTPYSIWPYNENAMKPNIGPSMDLARRGYIFVYQDVRGRFMSEGRFVNMRPYNDEGINENTDTYDTIEWLLENLPNHNGNVGLWGISYPGFYVSMGIINSHPAIKAASPQAPIADWYWDDVHHNGAFSLQLSFTFLYPFGQKRENLTTRWPSGFDFNTNDKYKFFKELGPLKHVNKYYFRNKIPFWNEIQKHPNYDEFWQKRNILPHLKNINCAVLTVGGFFDAEDLYGVLATYTAIEDQNPGISNRIVMGPWSHGAWARELGDSLGDASFGSNTSTYYQENIEFPFFEAHLYGDGKGVFPEAVMFETGKNQWREFEQWPPSQRKPKRYYLQQDHTLSTHQTASIDGFVEYVSKPSNPVPYTTENQARWGRKFMAEDQRFLADRKDVLVFTTEALSEDLTVAGPIAASLWVSTSRDAADWIVKIIDVQPKEKGSKEESGPQIMVRWEILRGRFRNSFSKPEAFIPDKPTHINIKLLDVMHTFKKGHKVMVQIQSSFFPFFDRNPQTYVDNIFNANRWSFKKATHKVYTNTKLPSNIEFGVMETD